MRVIKISFISLNRVTNTWFQQEELWLQVKNIIKSWVKIWKSDYSNKIINVLDWALYKIVKGETLIHYI